MPEAFVHDNLLSTKYRVAGGSICTVYVPFRTDLSSVNTNCAAFEFSIVPVAFGRPLKLISIAMEFPEVAMIGPG